MKTSFNIAEQGGGSYRLFAILRWVMVLIFVSFGIQKFTLQSAQGIVQYISNSPFISWLSVFGRRVQPAPVGRRCADGRDHVCHHMVVLLHDARCREMELVDRPDSLESDWRVHLQGYRLTLRLCRAASGVPAAIRDPIALALATVRGAANGRSLFVGKDVDQAAEWIANVKPAHVPGLTCRAILYGKSGSANAAQSFLQVVDLDRKVRHRCS
jgi:hypothetical protein